MGATGLAARCLIRRKGFHFKLLLVVRRFPVTESARLRTVVTMPRLAVRLVGPLLIVAYVPVDQPGTDPMSLPQANNPDPSCPPALDDLRQQLHQRLDQVIAACQDDYSQATFLDFETALLSHLSA